MSSITARIDRLLVHDGSQTGGYTSREHTSFSDEAPTSEDPGKLTIRIGAVQVDGQLCSRRALVGRRALDRVSVATAIVVEIDDPHRRFDSGWGRLCRADRKLTFHIRVCLLSRLSRASSNTTRTCC